MAAKSKLTRRGFLKKGSAGAATLGLGAWVASGNLAMTARAARRTIGANDRLIFGVIGTGGMGSGHVNELVAKSPKENIELIAVSDVYVRRAKANAARCQGRAYPDYRKLLDIKFIDCVVIATPDHWHFQAAMDAIDAGKQVYLQKPMVHTIEQAIKLRDKVRQTGTVLQVGTQHTADVRYWAAHKAIKDGLIGKVLWSQASYSRNSRGGEWNYHIDPDAGPTATGDAYIDWDMWLGYKFGCAPKVPWNPEHFFRFRKYWAYSGGIATDLFYHKLAPIVLAIEGPNGAYPKRVSSAGGIYVQKDGREVPDTFAVTIDYPGEHTVVLTSSMANNDQPPERIRGHNGTIDLGSASIIAQDAMKKEFHARSGGKDVVKLAGLVDWNPRRNDHMLNFIDAVRGKDRLNCNVELGTAVQVAITMSVLAYRQQKTLLWDPVKQQARPA